MANINYEYALNFEDNERKYQEIKETISEAVLFFTQNTLLQFLKMDLMCEMIDIQVAIDNGERGDFLYNSALSKVEEFKEVKKTYEDTNLKGSMEKLSHKISEKIRKNGKG